MRIELWRRIFASVARSIPLLGHAGRKGVPQVVKNKIQREPVCFRLLAEAVMRVVYAGDVLSRISRRREDPRGLRRGDRFVELREFSFPAISSALRPAGEDAGIVSRSRVRTEISPAIRSARIRAALRREIELSPRGPRFSFSDVHPPMLQVDVRFRERGNLMRARPLIEHQATAVGAHGGPLQKLFLECPADQKSHSAESRKEIHQLLSADMLAWTIATLRAREMFFKGRFVEVLWVAKIFVASNHIRLGYMHKNVLAQWEKDRLNEAARDESGVSEVRPNDAGINEGSA